MKEEVVAGKSKALVSWVRGGIGEPIRVLALVKGKV